MHTIEDPMYAATHAEGAKLLHESITKAIGQYDFNPGSLNMTNEEVAAVIRQNFDASKFDKLNEEVHMVESRAEYKARHPDGTQAFTLLIMWWADYYRYRGKKTHQYGWQIWINGGSRVTPRHILFPDDQPLKWFRITEVGGVIHPDYEVHKVVPLGPDGGQLEVDIEEAEYDEEHLGELEDARKNSEY